MVSVGSPPLHWNTGLRSLEVQVYWFFFLDPGWTIGPGSSPSLPDFGRTGPAPEGMETHWLQS